nr:immunoglobulin light chain junction region [Macaca mulatta]
CQQGKSNPVTF